MTPTLTHRIVPPAALALVCAVLWLIFTHTDRDTDSWILLYIGVTAAASVAVLLLGTDRWRPQGLGLLAFLLGVGYVYGMAGAIREGWRNRMAPWEVDAARACIVAGCTLILLGLCWWVWTRLHGSDDPAITPRRKETR